MLEEIIKNRTFGLELECGDLDRNAVVMPDGYKWSEDETLMNSNGTVSGGHARYGGEANTRPFMFVRKDLDELRDFIQSMKNAGGNLLWSTGFDAHLYCADLSLDVIKRMFVLSYYTALPLKKIFDIAEWWETKYLAPSPTMDVVKRVQEADRIENMMKIFANSSKRGYIRYLVNLCPLQRLGTIEFRLFNSSWDFEKTLETIKFMYSFVNYAYEHEDVSKYANLDSIEACIEAFNITYDKVPQRHKPLLWAGEHDNNVTTLGNMFNKSKSNVLFFITSFHILQL